MVLGFGLGRQQVQGRGGVHRVLVIASQVTLRFKFYDIQLLILDLELDGQSVQKAIKLKVVRRKIESIEIESKTVVMSER